MSTNSTAHVPARPLRQLVLQLARELTPVDEPGERIVLRRVRELQLGLLALGDVGEDALEARLPVLVDDPARLVAHPHDVPVGVQEAVLVVEQARLLGVALVAHDLRAVVRVDALPSTAPDRPSTARAGSPASPRSAGSRTGSVRPSPPPSGTRRRARPRAARGSAVRGGARRRCRPWVGGARPVRRACMPYRHVAAADV